MENALNRAYLFSQQNAWKIWCYENSSWQLQDVYVFVSHDVCINFVINAYYAVLRQFNFFFRVIIWSLSISASCKAQYLKGNCSHLKLQNWATKTFMSHAFFVEFMRKGIYLKLFNISGSNVQRVLILLYKVFVHWKWKLLNFVVDLVSLPWSYLEW